MTIYKIKYMHGDADTYTKETYEIKNNLKNKLVEKNLKIFEASRPEWRENFLNEIDDSLIEEYLIDNYEEDEDSPELWEEIEEILRKIRANEFLEILEKAFNTKSDLSEYELNRIEKLLKLENTIEDKEFYKEIFEVVWDLSDIYEMLIPDATCEDRFASIEKLEIKNSYLDEITKKLDSLSKKDLEKLKKLIDKKLN